MWRKNNLKNTQETPTVAVAAVQIPLTEQQAGDVQYFTDWLRQNAQMRDEYADNAKAEQYREKAMSPTWSKGKIIYPFCELHHTYNAITVATPLEILALLGLLLVWGIGLYFWGIPTLIITMVVVTFYYFIIMGMMFRLMLRAIETQPAEKIDNVVVKSIKSSDWPKYTILCPLYHEVVIIDQFAAAMNALDYPTDKLQILFLTEEDDHETRQAILNKHLPKHFSIITVPAGEPKTKPRACNYGLAIAEGEYVVIYDAEDIPDPLQLKKAVLTFASKEPDIACVQAQLHFYNSRQNILTRWFSLEYLLWFDMVLPGMQAGRLSLPLGGTSNHFRTDILRRLGAWDPFNVTEDCDLGLRLAGMKMRTAVVDSVTEEEANPQLKNWIRQRSRWIKGYLQTYLVHMRNPWRFFKPQNFREFFSLQFIIGGTPATFFLNPLMWSLFALYVYLRPVIEGAFHILYPAPSFYVGTVSLIFGNILYIYIYLIAAAKREQYHLMYFAILMPIYWALLSVAAMMALYQLITKPHHWEKTNHGLHLKYMNAKNAVKEHSAVQVAGE